MNWLFFAIASVITGSVANLYEKIVMREEASDPAASAIAFQIITGCIYLVFALYSGFHLPSISLIPVFIASMALYAAGTVYFFAAIKKIEASEMSIINSVGSIITIAISVLFLKDSFSLIQLLGVACIMTAVVLINYKKHGIVINQGVWLALAGSACYGVAVIFDTIIIHGFEAVSFIPLSAFGTATMLMIWYHKKLPKVITTFKNSDRNLYIFCLLYTLSAITFYLGIQNGALIGQMSTIARAMIVVTVLLSTVFLNERNHLWKKILGAILTTIGIILVSR